MNRQQLYKDLEADAVAAAAKWHRRKMTTATLLPMAALLTATVLMLHPAPTAIADPPTAGTPTPQPPAPTVREQATAPGGIEILDSDEQVLSALADLGPVITTDSRGRKVLLLTRAN